MEGSEVNRAKREFLVKVAYVAPVVATLAVMPRMASAGSAQHCNNGVGNGPDCLPPGLQNNGKDFLDNDDVDGVPGSPQNQGGNQGFLGFSKPKKH